MATQLQFIIIIIGSSALQIDDQSVLSDMEVCGVMVWRVWLMMARRQS